MRQHPPRECDDELQLRMEGTTTMKRQFKITGIIDADTDEHALTILRDEFDDYQFTNGIDVKRIVCGNAVEIKQ